MMAGSILSTPQAKGGRRWQSRGTALVSAVVMAACLALLGVPVAQAAPSELNRAARLGRFLQDGEMESLLRSSSSSTPVAAASTQRRSAQEPSREISNVALSSASRPDRRGRTGSADGKESDTVHIGISSEEQDVIDFQRRATKGRFTFEFSKAEIVDVVKAISDMTRRNFIIPEKLKGQRITVLSPTKITAREAYQVFLTALASSGVTIVKIGKFYKLVEAKNSIKTTIPTCVGPDEECPKFTDQMVTVLVHLKNIEGNQITSIVKPLMSKAGEVTYFQPTNALIMSEFAPNLARVRRIIDALDVPGFDDELQIVPVEYATATDIANKLTQIFEVSAGGTSTSRSKSSRKSKSGSQDSDEVQISKIIPDDRTNQLIIKANRRSFDAIKRLIGKLDVPISDVEQGKVHVYYLENASAEDLASTLSSLAQDSSSGSSSRRSSQARQGAGSSGGSRPESAVLFEGDVKVTADKSTNSLIIVASGHDFRALKAIIKKLDKPRRQVYVEVAVLEVTVNDNDQYGVDWHAPVRLSDNALGGLGGFGFLQSAQTSGGVTPTLAALTQPTSLLNVAGGSMAGIVGKGVDVPVGDSTLTLPSFGVILKWLQSSSSANILSTPHILTTDNEEATIEVGQRIPFQRGTSIPAAASLTGAAGATGLGGLGTNLFSATDRIDVSLALTLTPQINEAGKIRLEIDQKIEDLVGREEQTGQPITANRSANTVVVVGDGQTVVIGGLMRDRTRESESKIPFLGDLPFLGWFFKQRSSEIEKVNLLLVLTPYVIQDAADFQKVFERKLQEHEEFASVYYGDRPEYRAHVDYDRKSGPLAKLGQAVQRELSRIENGGTGLDDEVIVGPRSDEKGDSGRGERDRGSGSGSSREGDGADPTPQAPEAKPKDGDAATEPTEPAEPVPARRAAPEPQAAPSPAPPKAPEDDASSAAPPPSAPAPVPTTNAVAPAPTPQSPSEPQAKVADEALQPNSAVPTPEAPNEGPQPPQDGPAPAPQGATGEEGMGD